MLIERPLKVATPPTAACVVVPDSVPPGPAFVPIAKVTLAVEAVRLPEASSIRAVTDGVIEAPATVFVGCTVNFTCAAGPTVMLNVVEVSPVNPVLVAVRV